MEERHEFDFTLGRAGQFRHRVLSSRLVVAERGHEFDWRGAIVSDAVRPLRPVEEDLRDVVTAIHLADRWARRQGHTGRDGMGVRWGRHLCLRVGVREPDAWTPRVREALRKYLRLVAGDNCELDVVERPDWRPEQLALEWDGAREPRGRLGARLRNWRVALFSEGLDSLAGVCKYLRDDPEARLLLVTCLTNGRVSQLRNQLLSMMPPSERARVRAASFALRQFDAPAREQERSLRTRGLLFLTGGALAAQMMGLDELLVFENGLGAFNFEFDATQMPGQATRAVHPLGLAMFSEIVSELLRVRFRVVNPHLFSTKGEMCRVLDAPGWSEMIAHTFTCGHEHRRGGDRWHCGKCTSCVLRRWSLRAAGLWREDTARYVHDLSDPNSIAPQHRAEWTKARRQFRRIESCLQASGDEAIWRELRRCWPSLAETQDALERQGAMSAGEFRRGLLKLLRAHIAEGMEIGASPLQVLRGGWGGSSDVPGTLSLLDLDVDAAARVA